MTEEGEIVLLVAMKKIAVIRLATSILCTNLHRMKQDNGESLREYEANVRAAAAAISNYNVKCPHDCCKE